MTGTASRIPIEIYAAQHAVSERQVIKWITTGELPGYQVQGIWYVRVQIEQPKEPLIPTLPMPVKDYAQQTGISIAKILEDIANGNIPGFHQQGTWYVGSPKNNKHYLNTFSQWLLLLAVALISGIILWNWKQQSKSQSQLTTLNLEVHINNKIGKLRPAVQATFFLVTKSLEDIADDYLAKFTLSPQTSNTNITSNTTYNNPEWLNLVTSSSALRNLLFDLSSQSDSLNIWELQQNFIKSKLIWNQYVAYTATTNETGRAIFKDIIPGTYWVMGWYKWFFWLFDLYSNIP
ncbi:hypothetical protein TI03_06160, partial [Achromatium sp. WMS1]